MNNKLNKTTKIAAGLGLALALSACAPLIRKAPPVGAPLAEVTARLGKPTEIYPDPDGGQVLEYRGQPMGQFQHMAKIGADGRLQGYGQALTSENFARIEAGRWNKDDILRNFGRPAEIARARPTGYGQNDEEVWSYRYKEDQVWNSMMNVYFNTRGVVLRTGNTPDPLLDDRYKGF